MGSQMFGDIRRLEWVLRCSQILPFTVSHGFERGERRLEWVRRKCIEVRSREMGRFCIVGKWRARACARAHTKMCTSFFRILLSFNSPFNQFHLLVCAFENLLSTFIESLICGFCACIIHVLFIQKLLKGLMCGFGQNIIHLFSTSQTTCPFTCGDKVNNNTHYNFY